MNKIKPLKKENKLNKKLRLSFSYRAGEDKNKSKKNKDKPSKPSLSTVNKVEHGQHRSPSLYQISRLVMRKTYFFDCTIMHWKTL
jgi:hypothetical protein